MTPLQRVGFVLLCTVALLGLTACGGGGGGGGNAAQGKTPKDFAVLVNELFQNTDETSPPVDLNNLDIQNRDITDPTVFDALIQAGSRKPADDSTDEAGR